MSLPLTRPGAVSASSLPPLGARVARRVVSLCMFCGSARVPARSPGDAERWAPLAPAVLDELRGRSPDLVVSHGLCPACARRHYPDLVD